jgi:hypothetical protein
MALVVPDKNAFQHILRLLNTNVDGKDKVMFALTKIKGVGRRYSNVVVKKVCAIWLRFTNNQADVDLNKRFSVTALLLTVVLANLPPKNSNVSSRSSRILLNTKSLNGFSIDSAIL